MYDYYNDIYGIECLNLAHKCKSDMRFGAIFVKENKILGRGWNRLSTVEDRSKIHLTHVDYAIHGEQACILDAIQGGYDVSNGNVYVLGYSNKLQTRGNLSTRESKSFTCKKCAQALIRYAITVFIPHIEQGWIPLTGEEAMESAKGHLGYWTNFVNGK